jgi:UDP-glucose 4-epimerase
MNTCLIIGGNGFIGSHLAERLADEGYKVRVIDNFSNEMANLQSIKNKIEIIKGDYLDSEAIAEALNNIDYVFHYASTTVPSTAKSDPVYDIETNVIGSIKLFQFCLKHGVKKVIFSSSGGTVYGEPVKIPMQEDDPTDPIGPYGISKLIIEKLLYHFYYAYGLEYTILRYSNPYGERQNPNGTQGVIPIFLNKLKQGEKLTVFGDGSMIRDYIYIKDAIDATLAVFKSDTKKRVFNIGSGEGTSINELLSIISKLVGKTFQTEFVKVSGIYVQKVILDISRIQNQTDWEPTTNLEEGIKRTWNWIKTKSKP